MWQVNRPSFEIKTIETLHSASKLNSSLIHSSMLIDKKMNGARLYDILKHFYNKQTISPIQTMNTWEASREFSNELQCCSEISPSGSTTRDDSILTVKKIFLDSQLVPLEHYISTLIELKSIIEPNINTKNNVLNLNFCHMMTKDFKLGKFYSIFKKMSIKCFNFVDLFYASLRSLQDDKENETDQNENTKETLFGYFRKFANSTASLLTSPTTNISSFIHSNWLDEYLSSIYMSRLHIDSNNRSKNNANNYIFSIELVLNLFDRKLLQFNEMNEYLWSNYEFLCNECSKASIMSLDEHLLFYLKTCIDEIKRDHFEGSDQAFLSYLQIKCFNKGKLFEIKVREM